MPGSLDSCINNVFEVGSIPASSGLPPVRVLYKDALVATISETAAAVDTVDVAGAALAPREAMLPGVFINSGGTPRQANANGVMVNL